MSCFKSPTVNIRQIWFLIIGFALTVGLTCGCAKTKEAFRTVAGISTQELENNREKSIKKVFKYDYFTCYAKTKDALARIGAHIYAEDKEKDLIAIYVSRKDTTPVGLFFQDIDNTHTQMEVASPSAFARDLIAEKIFANLETSFNQNEKRK